MTTLVSRSVQSGAIHALERPILRLCVRALVVLTPKLVFLGLRASQLKRPCKTSQWTEGSVSDGDGSISRGGSHEGGRHERPLQIFSHDFRNLLRTLCPCSRARSGAMCSDAVVTFEPSSEGKVQGEREALRRMSHLGWCGWAAKAAKWSTSEFVTKYSRVGLSFSSQRRFDQRVLADF